MSEENPQTGTEETDSEELFDLLIPPGVPSKLIIEITQKFDVEVVPACQARGSGAKRHFWMPATDYF